jgi:tetratricopeptide (TPR) repeat protein
MSEQGVVACAFDSLCALPIPLAEFPFGRAFEENLNYGLAGPNSNCWGFHFGNAFRRENPHFRRLAAEGRVFWMETEPPPEERFLWLVNRGQWGTPGWSMHPICVKRIAMLAHEHAGRRVLELGTSRGFLAAIMAAYGCIVTTVDKVDRGASANLKDMGIRVVVSDVADFLRRDKSRFSLVTVDIHDNSREVWNTLWPLVSGCLEAGGVLVLYNTHLWQMTEWSEETGLRWITESPPPGWSTEVFPEPVPGMVVCRLLGTGSERVSGGNRPVAGKSLVEREPNSTRDPISNIAVADVASALRAAERAILNLTEERDRLAADNSSLEGQWAAARSEIAALNAEHNRLAADNAQLNKAVTEMTARHDAIAAHHAQLDRALQGAQGEISSLIRERDQAAAARLSIETFLARMQAEAAEETGRLSRELHTQNTIVEAVIAACSDRTLWSPPSRAERSWLRRLAYSSIRLPRRGKRRGARALIEKGDRARNAKAWMEAARNYRAGLSLMPDAAAIWVQYGHALKESGHVGGAEAAYRRSLEINPNVADTHIQLAHALKLQGRRFEAVATSFRAISLNPNFSYVLHEMTAP